MSPLNDTNDLYDQSLVKIRFKGENLIENGVPIYELGETFIAFQRIIHKCYLFQNKKLESGARLSPQERINCALNVLDRKKESDGYGLAAFLADPTTSGILCGLLANAITALGKYVYQNVFTDKEESEELKLLRAIRNDVGIITERVGNVGGVEQIDLIPGKGIDAKPVSISNSRSNFNLLKTLTI